MIINIQSKNTIQLKVLKSAQHPLLKIGMFLCLF